MPTPINYYRLALKPTEINVPKLSDFMKRNKQLAVLLLQIIKQSRMIKKYHRVDHNVDVIKILHKIIPFAYFGCSKHRKIFEGIVKKILTQSANECIYASQLFSGFDHNSIPWLEKYRNCELEFYRQIIFDSNVYLVEKIVKPLIRFFYKAINTYRGQEIIFIRRRNWFKMQDRAFRQLRKAKTVLRDQDSKIKSRGQLKLVPKTNREIFRPIICLFKDTYTQKMRFKSINKKLYKAAAKVMHYYEPSLYKAWSEFARIAGNQPIFGVKLDIQDAFGNVDMALLSHIIGSMNEATLSKSDKDFVLRHINNQFITYGRKNKLPLVWKWQKGLIQGDRLSASLCEVYLAQVDRIYLVKFWERPNSFFHRTVDDYFFCSTDRQSVDEFQSAVAIFHKLNKEKTEVNYGTGGNHWIKYCGNYFNLGTKEVKKLHQYPGTFCMRHKFKLWNFKSQIPQRSLGNFLKRPMKFPYNNGYFMKMQLNTKFNSEETVLRNFFESMILMAYKFDCAIMAIARVDGFKVEMIEAALKSCVLEFCTITKCKIRSCKGIHYTSFLDDLQVLIRLSFKAFLLVFGRRPTVYYEVIEHIKKTQQLKILFPAHIDYRYFQKMPDFFRSIKMNRAPDRTLDL